MREMNKLVRDKIPDIIKQNGDIPFYHVLNEEEYKKYLFLKMMEEYNEILGAKTNEEVLEECADLLEVIFAYAKAHNFSERDLLDMRGKKREKRGGFDKKIFLERTE